MWLQARCLSSPWSVLRRVTVATDFNREHWITLLTALGDLFV